MYDIKHITVLLILGIALNLNAQNLSYDINGHKEACRYCLHGEHKNDKPYTINFKNETPTLLLV